MHDGAMAYVRGVLSRHPPRRSVVEFGSRDVNGSTRGLFGSQTVYRGVDIAPGPGVDIVCDASEFAPQDYVDTVICCEVLEHTPKCRDMVDNAASILTSGGLFIVTAATVNRDPHSAIDGGPLRDGEWYRNIPAWELYKWLSQAGFMGIEIDLRTHGDIYALGVK